MGREICRAALETEGIELSGGTVERGAPELGSDLGELCGSAVIDLSQEFHRRDAEHAELTLRKTIIPTDS